MFALVAMKRDLLGLLMRKLVQILFGTALCVSLEQKKKRIWKACVFNAILKIICISNQVGAILDIAQNVKQKLRLTHDS